ncbi:histone deacetylase 8-like [Schistocerca serialis cubense]|uniref:histone deacetylase 8-like n=1 Tax=Schistocerca serialis cubense TaxID=2023355 RepID=UPI00214E1BD9|nr:histone deacetylase 8-like [Schistocerca serialis cubense]
MSSNCTKKVVYVDSKQLRKECDRIPQVNGRATLVHELIVACGLLNHLTPVPSRLATEEEISSFHSRLYIDFLQQVNESDDLEAHEDEQEEFGLGYDTPLLSRMYDHVRVIGGGSVVAAEALTSSGAEVAINWCGGWHHAQRDGAEGFCYVNDIAMAILKMCKKFQRILYVDMDLHHGDGVQNAFASTSRVMTLSLHHHGPGIYPCSGDVTDIGISNGRYYAVNVPLREGVSDSTYCDVFQKVTEKVFDTYQPDALVVQCGADGLHGDPVGCAFNLTSEAYATCASLLLSRGLPTLFLGGGGYNLPNTARCWAALTAAIAGCKLPAEVPEHDFLGEYGPYFEFGIQPSLRKDYNTKEYIDSIVQQITENLKHVELKEKSQSSEKR